MEKFLNVLLFTQEHVDERKNKESVRYYDVHFRDRENKEELIENLDDSLWILRSRQPLNQLVPRDWDGKDPNTRFVSPSGEIYQEAYNLNDGTQIYSSFWDFYVTDELRSLPQRFAAFREWLNKNVTEWAKVNGFVLVGDKADSTTSDVSAVSRVSDSASVPPTLTYTHESDKDGVYFEKYRFKLIV